MKHFEVNGNCGRFALNLPQRVAEINTTFLNNCTKHITVAPNYALVAIAYKNDLNVLLTAMNKKKPTNVPIVPIAVKLNVPGDNKFYNDIKLGDVVVVSASDLSIGNHIVCPANTLSPSNIAAICEGDRNIYRETIGSDNKIYLVEFKLIPISAIKARLDADKCTEDTGYVIPRNDNEESAN